MLPRANTEKERERIIITVTFTYLNTFGNGNTIREGINCRYEKSKIVPHSVKYRACSILVDLSVVRKVGSEY